MKKNIVRRTGAALLLSLAMSSVSFAAPSTTATTVTSTSSKDAEKAAKEAAKAAEKAAKEAAKAAEKAAKEKEKETQKASVNATAIENNALQDAGLTRAAVKYVNSWIEYKSGVQYGVKVEFQTYTNVKYSYVYSLDGATILQKYVNAY